MKSARPELFQPTQRCVGADASAHADGAPAAEADAAAACGGGAFDARFASGDGGWAGAPRFG